MLSAGHYLVSFTASRPNSRSVRVTNYPWTGGTYLGIWTYDGVHYDVGQNVSTECGL